MVNTPVDYTILYRQLSHISPADVEAAAATNGSDAEGASDEAGFSGWQLNMLACLEPAFYESPSE